MFRLSALFPMLVLLCQMMTSGNMVHELKYPERLYEITTTQDVYDTVQLKAMVVPHHTVPMDKLKKMYVTASSDAVMHVIVLSPDHFTSSSRPVLTSLKNWMGPFGYVKTDVQMTNEMIALDFVYKDDDEIIKEHGITAHIPLIRDAFPKAEVTVLAVSKQVTVKALNQLINTIPENTFVIASVDFSHYYDLNKANTFDDVTKELMLSKRYQDFFGMSDAYFDTPGVLYTVFTWAEKMHYTYQIYDQSNSAYYFDRKLNETTSYFFIGFY